MFRFILAAILITGLAVAQNDNGDAFPDYTEVTYTVEWLAPVDGAELEAVEGNRGRGRGAGATWYVQDWHALVYQTTTVYTYDAEAEEYVIAEQVVLVAEAVLPRYQNPGGQWVDGQTLRNLDTDELVFEPVDNGDVE